MITSCILKCLPLLPACDHPPHRKMHKKLSAGTFTRDSTYVLFADKFGDVAVAAVQPTPSPTPELLLGHLCSIVTSVAVSPDNK